jgi:hypothetical protein
MNSLKKLAIAFLLAVPVMQVSAADGRTFDPSKGGEERTITYLDGATVKYRAYENLYYVTNVEDSMYQYMNIYVPETAHKAGKGTPVFLRTYVGGYMSTIARTPEATDASGRALREGYVLCIPGTRGANSTIVSTDKKGKTTTTYTGRAPKALLDLKAAIRYLRYNDAAMPGDAELIITDGTSAGGAMSSLLGATGNHPVYESYLKAMGAADVRDDIWACVCYCPITDLEHADMAYEWLYKCTNSGVRGLNAEQQLISEELAAQYPAYINSLGLKNPQTGEALTADNFLDYIKSYLIRSLQRGRDEGSVLPDTIGVKFYEPKRMDDPGAPQGGRPPGAGMGGRGPRHKEQANIVQDLDMEKYLAYVVSIFMLKTPPAFDSMDILGGRASNENQVFGDSEGNSLHFTNYGLQKATADSHAVVNEEIQKNVYMYNPLNFIGNAQATTAPHWFIRHGARDRDTSFNVPVTLATMLMNRGYEVDFFLPWNRPHSGDYNLNDLFEWIHTMLEKSSIQLGMFNGNGFSFRDNN